MVACVSRAGFGILGFAADTAAFTGGTKRQPSTSGCPILVSCGGTRVACNFLVRLCRVNVPSLGSECDQEPTTKIRRLLYSGPCFLFFYITCCTRDRRSIRELAAAHDALTRYGERAREHNVAVGRYVLMPDHLHLFVKGDGNFMLPRWVGGLKRAIAVELACRSGKLWQPGFFDHILRSDESYAQKWEYVLQNPVRAGLVKNPEDWRYHGEIVMIDRV